MLSVTPHLGYNRQLSDVMISKKSLFSSNDNSHCNNDVTQYPGPRAFIDLEKPIIDWNGLELQKCPSVQCRKKRGLHCELQCELQCELHCELCIVHCAKWHRHRLSLLPPPASFPDPGIVVLCPQPISFYQTLRIFLWLTLSTSAGKTSLRFVVWLFA